MLRPLWSGQRSMSIPPPGGSTRITSAPSAANVAPPSGAAMKADSSTMRSPARIGVSAGPGIVQGLGSLLLEARRQSFVDVLEDRRDARPRQLLHLALGNLDLGADLLQCRSLLGGRPDALADRKAPHAFDRIPLLCLVDLSALAILLRVVGGVVKSHSIGPAFDERRTLARKRPHHRVQGSRVNGQ